MTSKRRSVTGLPIFEPRGGRGYRSAHKESPDGTAKAPDRTCCSGWDPQGERLNGAVEPRTGAPGAAREVDAHRAVVLCPGPVPKIELR